LPKCRLTDKHSLPAPSKSFICNTSRRCRCKPFRSNTYKKQGAMLCHLPQRPSGNSAPLRCPFSPRVHSPLSPSQFSSSLPHCPLPTCSFTLLHFPFWSVFLFNHFRTLLLFAGGRGVASLTKRRRSRNRSRMRIAPAAPPSAGTISPSRPHQRIQR